jgi:poly(3-hydroxybutyrate) depolymerase
LYISGTRDPLPKEYEFTFEQQQIRIQAPLQNLTAAWAAMLECPANQKLFFDKDGVKGVMQDSCQHGTKVVRYSVEGLGHVWPGGRSDSASSAFNATDVIWDFFQQHLP